MLDLAVVGAGVCGLVATRRLRALRPDWRVAVFERGAQPGGRAFSRTVNGFIVDHGAQFVHSPTAEIERLLTVELGHETLVDIGRPVWTFRQDNVIEPGDPAHNAPKKWAYADGFARLGSELARGLDLRLGAEVAQLAPGDERFALLAPDGDRLGDARQVLLTLPAPAGAALLERSELPAAARQTLVSELGKVAYRRCRSIATAYPPVLRARPWYALVNLDRQHPITWLAYEHLKPGRQAAGLQVVLTQMAPAWSAWAASEPAAADAELDRLLADLLGEPLPAPLWRDAVDWPHALPDGQADFERLQAEVPGLYLAGDFTAGLGRVHLAIEQGWRVAERIANRAR